MQDLFVCIIHSDLVAEATLTRFSLPLQRLIEMKAMTAVRTKSEREKKEKRRQEKEAAKLQEQ